MRYMLYVVDGDPNEYGAIDTKTNTTYAGSDFTLEAALVKLAELNQVDISVYYDNGNEGCFSIRESRESTFALVDPDGKIAIDGLTRSEAFELAEAANDELDELADELDD